MVQIFGSGTYAEPIADEEIAAIQCIMERCQPYEAYPYPAAKGTVVQVIREPLTAFTEPFQEGKCMPARHCSEPHSTGCRQTRQQATLLR